jgi:hypothetical protein
LVERRVPSIFGLAFLPILVVKMIRKRQRQLLADPLTHWEIAMVVDQILDRDVGAYGLLSWNLQTRKNTTGGTGLRKQGKAKGGHKGFRSFQELWVAVEPE